MKKNTGRYPNIDYFEEILYLPSDELFSPAQITNRKYDRVSEYYSYRRMLNALFRYGDRNGLRDSPDNCYRKPNGRPVRVNGKVKLLPGEQRAKWYGKTWRSHFYDEDLIHFQHQKRLALLKTLQAVLQERQQQECPPVVTLQEHPSYGGRPMPQFKWKKKWLLIAAVALVLTGASLYNYNVLGQGYQIMRSEGPKAALTFFQNRGETYDSLFGIGWNAFREGDYETALEYGNRVLLSRKVEDRARASYLLGVALTNLGGKMAAEEHLKTALDLYHSLNKPLSEFRCQMAIARLNLTYEDVEVAEYYANLAEATYDAWNDQFFLYLKSQIAFLRHDYQGALALVQQRELLVKEDQPQLAGVYGDMGFYHLLLGNLEKGFEYTMMTQNLAIKLESEKLAIYNTLNFYLYMKCTLRDFSYYRETALGYARLQKDTRLLEKVYFVDKANCAIPSTDPGDPDPPDDPPPAPLSQTPPQDPSFQGMKKRQE